MTPATTEQLLSEAVQLFQSGELDKAEAACTRLLETAPQHPHTLQLLGFINFSLGRTGAAIDCLKQAVQADPENIEAHFNLGRAYEELGNFEEAVSSYRTAHQLNPDDLEILDTLGRTLIKQGLFADAEDCFRRAVALSPNLVACHVNLGNTLMNQRRFEEAEASYRKALTIDDQLAPAYNGLGHALLEQGNANAALDAVQQALNLDPDFVDAHVNLGNIFKATGRIDDSISSYREALKHDPENADAHFNLAVVLLLSGNLEDGWREYEWRWQWKYFTALKRELPHKEWSGEHSNEDLTGTSVIAWGEQGIGDEIMFASCLPDLIQEAATVTVECEPRLLPLFQRSFPGINLIPKEDQPASTLVNQAADFQMALGSLGQRFRPSVEAFPKRDSYLKADVALTNDFKQRYQSRYPGKKLIGISWKSGNVELGVARTAPLDLWHGVFKHTDCAFINLQYGDVRTELGDFTQRTGFDIFYDESVDPLKNMDAFAAQLSALDLIISIDNSTVHLAGALGLPTWTLLPVVPDWRWMLERHDTPWYPSMRLFRQQAAGTWDDIFPQITAALAVFRNNNT